MADASHTSGYATEYLYPRSNNSSAKNALNAASGDLNTYNARTTRICLPASEPNSGLAVVHIFSRQGDVRYAFCISHPIVDKPLSAAIVRAIMTISLETTDEYIMDEGNVIM